jgi:3-deoxy-7-phosphoheptulonate synthase
MLIKISSTEQLHYIKSHLEKRLITHKTFSKGDETFIYVESDVDELSDLDVIPEIRTSLINKKSPITIGDDILFSDANYSLVAGPCAFEDETTLSQTAELLKKIGIKMLRCGANKLRTSPYSFQGLGVHAIHHLADICRSAGLYSVTEITCITELELFAKHVDIILVGTRNMHNYQLLKELGKLDKPIILKRGMSATVHEWLLAAEYMRISGNEKIVLCERGIRTFACSTRYTFDLATAVFVAQNHPFHVITDPSHATGDSSLVPAMTLATLVSRLHGSMIEIHPEPNKASSDKEQMLDFDMFQRLVDDIAKIKSVL